MANQYNSVQFDTMIESNQSIASWDKRAIFAEVFRRLEALESAQSKHRTSLRDMRIGSTAAAAVNIEPAQDSLTSSEL